MVRRRGIGRSDSRIPGSGTVGADPAVSCNIHFAFDLYQTLGGKIYEQGPGKDECKQPHRKKSSGDREDR